MRSLRSSSTGETIVEVMISIAILSMAIVGAIQIMRSSLLLGQSANERTQAFRIAEAQIERMKARAGGDISGEGIFSGAEFCLADDLSIVSLPAPQQATCGNSYFPSSNMIVRVTYSENGPDGATGPNSFDDDLFVIEVSWDSVSGGERDQVIIDYRLHPI